MNARILTTATLATVICAVLPARAADPQLLNLVMPDAKVLAGVNVDQAKTSAFGQYLIGQFNAQTDPKLQELIAATGFDPTRDVHEILVATSGGTTQQTGLFLARGSFDPSRIAAFAASKGEAASEVYKGVTILEDQKKTGGVAFLNAIYVVGGDLASVKGAIDRQTVAAPLPAAVATEVNKWSGTQDAWAITTVPPSSLHPGAGMPAIPGIGPGGQGTALQNIQNAAGGVKFGANVVVTTQATAATAQDAAQMGDAIKLLASLAQMQSNADPNLLALTRSLQVTTNGNLLSASVSLPQDTLIRIVTPKKTVGAHRIEHKKQ